MEKTEVHVGAIGIDKDSGDSVLLLKDTNNRRALPVWVGLPEARAISNAIRNIVSPRPSTHELLFATILQLGCEIKEVVITELKNDAFIAEIILRRAGAREKEKERRMLAEEGLPMSKNRRKEPTIVLDARPSDAIALALMCDAPVFVAAQILAEVGISVNPEQDQKEAAEFKEFLENVKASDFKLAGKLDANGDDPPNS
ncbi:MAG: bifunctional nuclease family protein [Cyanobacteria bacterium SZAS LIN-2]|nr:bifunctional nuclease family protein [Cyanobacteria bacterium SZAS LIN-3]MBS1994730.1 bifunctional nuclease family protein [Cyanobacteria bacterium SZAS LIN-2]MBS2006936.1 bifunctional nuclease family protein [Cyanobacteria bacterium SZAS TMP-1]